MDQDTRAFLAKVKKLNLSALLANKASGGDGAAGAAAAAQPSLNQLLSTKKKGGGAGPDGKKTGGKTVFARVVEDRHHQELPDDDGEGEMMPHGMIQQGKDFHPDDDDDGSEPDVMSVARSIVKVFVSANSPDHGQPYQLQRAEPSIGSGFFLEFNGEPFIITNAHVVANWTSVHVKRYGSARKWKAQVLVTADTCDLAVLTVPSKAFWRSAELLQLSEPPALNSPVFVCGYPTGGDELSVTSGVVSRFGVQPFAHSGDSYMSIQISAPINSGNSGGPVLQYDPLQRQFFVAGVAFEAMMGANSIGYMICPSVVDHMLQQWAGDFPAGCPSINLISSEIESKVQRQSLFIPPLAGFLDYLYDLSKIKDTVTEMLKSQGLDLAALLENGGFDPESDEGKEAMEGMFEGGTGEGPTQAEHFIVNHDQDYDYVIFRKSPDDDEDDDDFYNHPDDEEDDGFDSDFAADDDDDEDVVLGAKKGKDNKDTTTTTTTTTTADTTKSKSTKSAKSKTERSFPTNRPTMKDVSKGGKPSIKVKSPLSPKHDDKDDENTLDEHLKCDGTALYRIKRFGTSETRPPPPAKLLPLLLSDNGIYDTQVGVIVRNIIPHSPTADILQVGDVILSVDDIPISSDETILFREAERVRYSYITTNHQIGDKIPLMILRGFDIIRLEVEVQKKTSIAPLFFHQVPQWLVALGLLFVPLSGNLLEAEFGEEWPAGSPISLLQSLFMGILERFHPDEEVIVLTSVLPHSSTEGYTNAMEKLTHVNGERVINMKHLSEILNAAVDQHTRSKAEFEKAKAQRDAADKKDEGRFDSTIPPAKFFEEFTKKLEAYSKSSYINFKTHSGEIVTLSLEDGHKNQVEILKLHQIPLPGCCDSLKPMYEMEIDMKFKNPGLQDENVQKLMLMAPELNRSKSLQRANIKSPYAASPRDSGYNLKALTALEVNPELSQAQHQFPNDFSDKSPAGHLKKFAKRQPHKAGKAGKGAQ